MIICKQQSSMKHVWMLFILIATSACQPAQATSTNIEPTVLTADTQEPTLTFALAPSLPPTSSATPLGLIYSTPLSWSGEGNNPGFEPIPVGQVTEPPSTIHQVTTVTPSDPEQCPNENSSLVLDIRKLLNDPLPYVDIEKTVLDFMNSGGTPNAVIKAFAFERGDSDIYYYLNQDLTGDGVPEFVITYGGYLDIFGCKSGNYVTALKIQNTINNYPIYIGPVKDMNLNGVPELILSTITCNGPCTEVRIYEWSDEQYKSLLRVQFNDYWFDYAQIYSGTISIQDLDGNGFIEMILDGGFQHKWLP